jgi:hypothetical protein
MGRALRSDHMTPEVRLDSTRPVAPLLHTSCHECGALAKVYRDGSRRRCQCGADPVPVAPLVALAA